LIRYAARAVALGVATTAPQVKDGQTMRKPLREAGYEQNASRFDVAVHGGERCRTAAIIPSIGDGRRRTGIPTSSGATA